LTALGLVAALSVFVVDEGVRVERDVRRVPLIEGASSASLEALRGEHAAFQIVVETDDRPADRVRVVWRSERFPLDAFVGHFVDVSVRSRNERSDAEALAFLPAARPPDATSLGTFADALVPLAITPEWAYPVSLEPRQRAVFWFDVFVPEDTEPGFYREEITVSVGMDAVALVPVNLRVVDRVLPYRATSAFAYYERPTLEKRFVDPNGAEKQLVQLLHAHHLETLCQVTTPEHARRIRGAYDGSWFTPGERYRGPGVGVPATLAAIGTYGTLGDPTPAKVETVKRIAAEIPPSIADLFVYAIDETCDSPRGPRWRALLRDYGLWPRVIAGHTCHRDPATQDLDLVMVPAQTFDVGAAKRARAKGQRVWIYNGQLPFASPPNIDVPLTALTYNGWIGASYDVGRWFYWETIFWHDGNQGGRGPTDVFVNVETFHNADGDTSLYDGLLLFPGRTPPRIGTHDLGFDGVIPSIRLKSLRRGLQDAGLLALAAQVDPGAAASIARRAVGAALDEVGPGDAPFVTFDPEELRALRHELRDLAARGAASPARADVDRGLAALRLARDRQQHPARDDVSTHEVSTLVSVGLPAALFGSGLIVAAALARRAERRQRRRAA